MAISQFPAITDDRRERGEREAERERGGEHSQGRNVEILVRNVTIVGVSERRSSGELRSVPAPSLPVEARTADGGKQVAMHYNLLQCCCSIYVERRNSRTD